LTVMSSRRYALSLIVLSLVSFSAASIEAHKNSEDLAGSAPIRVGTILHNPPYVTENPSSGIDLDTIRTVYGSIGREVAFVHAPLSRVELLLKSGQIDAMTTVGTQKSQCVDSDIFGYWHDGISVPRLSSIKVMSVADLKGLTVGLFPGAETVLTQQLSPHAEGFADRITIYSTDLAVKMLAYERIDAYIGDVWGLEYAYQELSAKGEVDTGEQKPFFTAVYFEPTPRRLCFRDNSQMAQFNDALNLAKTSGALKNLPAPRTPRPSHRQ